MLINHDTTILNESVQFSRLVVSDSPGPNGLLHARLPCPSPTPRSCSNSHTHIHWVGDAIQPSHPLSSPSPPALNLPQHQCLFQWIRWPKYWSFSFSITASNKYLGMIPFRIDWIDLLAVQETLRSLVQHYSLNISVLWSSAFFMVQLSHPYMTTGKNHTFDYTDLCQQSDVSALICCLGLS